MIKIVEIVEMQKKQKEEDYRTQKDEGKYGRLKTNSRSVTLK